MLTGLTQVAKPGAPPSKNQRSVMELTWQVPTRSRHTWELK